MLNINNKYNEKMLVELIKLRTENEIKRQLLGTFEDEKYILCKCANLYYISVNHSIIKFYTHITPLNKDLRALNFSDKQIQKGTQNKSYDLKVIEVYTNYYHSFLNYLEDDKRAFLDERIKADKYYLTYYNGSCVGGFATNGNGYLTGLFSLKKGFGNAIQKERIIQAKKDLTEGNKFTLFCTGDFLKEYYIKRGFAISDIIAFNKSYASKKWDYERFGTPKLYNMYKVI